MRSVEKGVPLYRMLSFDLICVYIPKEKECNEKLSLTTWLCDVIHIHENEVNVWTDQCLSERYLEVFGAPPLNNGGSW